YLIGINAELFYAIRLHCLTNHCHMRGMLNDPALYPMQRLCLKPKKITTMGRQENRNFLTKEDFQKKRHQTLGNNPMSMDGVVGISSQQFGCSDKLSQYEEWNQKPSPLSSLKIHQDTAIIGEFFHGLGRITIAININAVLLLAPWDIGSM